MLPSRLPLLVLLALLVPCAVSPVAAQHRELLLPPDDGPVFEDDSLEHYVDPLSSGEIYVAPGYTVPYGTPWTLQLVPDSLIYRSYLAGGRESRFASVWFYEPGFGWRWDSTLGGRVGLLRYGTDDPLKPEGWQLDIEGAAFPRLDLENNRDLVSSDFRFGIPLTYGVGPVEAKLAYYHLSSHLGDEFMLRNPNVPRLNYTRDAIVLGLAWWLKDDTRLYGEAGYAFYNQGGSRPWEFQFGIDYSPLWATGLCGTPFFAINGHLRQEVDFGGNLIVQTGWQWRGRYNGSVVRAGFQYFNGKSLEFQFFDEHEEHFGLGLWYDY